MNKQAASWVTTLSLAFQSIGVIYGDIGTSPLYVFSSTFPDGIDHKDDILGVLSLIIYTIILVPMVKYVFIVLWANDNGDGGTFALYSKICRYANVALIPKNQPEDTQLSNYRMEETLNETKGSQKMKETMEKSLTTKIVLFLVTILGTSMVIGDVLSAVGGIKSLSGDAVVYISILILIGLFCVQRFGTDKVGYAFAPVLCLWFLFITVIGVYNLFKHDASVLRAFNPKYIIEYFKRTGKKGWISLGGAVLCITGTEAMFADLGHFNVPAVQISFSTVVFPSILLAYIGQASYLSKFPENAATVFYDSIPTVIASQAMISGTFAIISQSLSLGCFPRVKVVHTSSKYEGQVYIPEINYIFMVACVLVTYGFKTTVKIGNAYGIAVVSVMLITTSLLTLIMILIWKTKIWWTALFFTVFMSIELVYFSSVLYKFVQGGYLPLAFSFVLMSMMAVWHYAQKQRYMFELKNKVPNNYVLELAKNRQDINRIPGIGLLYSELVEGIPPIFPHFISNIPSIHSVIVFVSIKSLPISKVIPEERFLFRQVEPREYRIFCCVVRYGYKDLIEEPSEFENQLVENLKEFIKKGNQFHEGQTAHAEEEMKFVERAKEEGVFYLIGEADVVAKKDSSIVNKFVINKAYPFLRKNFRQGQKLLAIPQTRLLRVGMTYEV
ncbi:hypothetical protein DH2020_003873 [Rehmannia glutinosa]|uniref:Potassium transporter n=1 Tax=Rehmannia glutinosa TaxID=99300 RepID=A0ABR0XMY8_REHGL